MLVGVLCGTLGCTLPGGHQRTGKPNSSIPGSHVSADAASSLIAPAGSTKIEPESVTEAFAQLAQNQPTHSELKASQEVKSDLPGFSPLVNSGVEPKLSPEADWSNTPSLTGPAWITK